jgi:hypothetical protein
MMAEVDFHLVMMMTVGEEVEVAATGLVDFSFLGSLLFLAS